MNTLWQDLRYGARTLLKKPGFALVAVLTLGLGIGANTAIFSVVNGVLLRPFVYPDAEQIMLLTEYELSQPTDSMSVTYPNFLDWRKQQQVFSHLAAARDQTFNLTGVAEPVQVKGAMISPEAFPLLAVAPHIGRVFTDQDNQLSSERTVVLSYGFWQRQFGGDPNVIGRGLLLDNQSYAVIGVMPPRFKFWAADVWVPYGLFANEPYFTSRLIRAGNFVVGRLKPGVTVEQARAEISLIAERLARQYPDSNKDIGAKVTPLGESVTREIRPALLVLLGAVAFVLLIACVNVAGLLLARAAAREKELAIRAALGASRLRLVRQLLLEGLPLAVMGGVAGLLLAGWGLELLLALLPDDVIPAEASVGLDARVLGFTLLLTLLTALLCGLLPALRYSRGDLNEGLKDGARFSTGNIGNRRARGALVVLEVALSVVLLVGAGLLIKSFARLQQSELGFNRESLLTVDLVLSLKKYSRPQQLEAFYRDVLERLSATPGVESAAFMNGAPFSNFGASMPFVREGAVYRNLQDLSGHESRYFITHGDYLGALGLPLAAGRGFTAQDTLNSLPVAIINQAAADKFFPGEDPLGKRIILGLPEHLIQPGMLPEGMEKFPWLTVVGVVKNHRQSSLGQEFQPTSYVPLAQAPRVPLMLNTATLLVRAAGEPVALVSAVRREILAVDPDQPLARVATMEARIDDSLKLQRFSMSLMGLFAALALALAVVGLYGVLAYTVVERTHEIGVRLALGASARDIVRLIVGQGMRLTLIGLGLGVAGALALTRLMARLLFNVSAADPATFVFIAAVLVGVALLACYIPARRATRIDPMAALRCE
jgi:putative ABC transport system permease protein